MEKKKSLLFKREAAKIGMSTSLALTVGSAFFLKSKAGKQIHLASGLALVGFSLWHHMLYDKKNTVLECEKCEKEDQLRLPSGEGKQEALLLE